MTKKEIFDKIYETKWSYLDDCSVCGKNHLEPDIKMVMIPFDGSLVRYDWEYIAKNRMFVSPKFYYLCEKCFVGDEQNKDKELVKDKNICPITDKCDYCYGWFDVENEK